MIDKAETWRWLPIYSTNGTVIGYTRNVKAINRIRSQVREAFHRLFPRGPPYIDTWRPEFTKSGDLVFVRDFDKSHQTILKDATVDRKSRKTSPPYPQPVKKEVDKFVFGVGEECATDSFQFFYCAHCKFKATRFKFLVSHIGFKHPERELFECAHCDFVSREERKLDLHIREEHKKRWAYERLLFGCKECGFAARNGTSFEQHYTFTHAGGEPGGSPQSHSSSIGLLREASSHSDYDMICTENKEVPAPGGARRYYLGSRSELLDPVDDMQTILQLDCAPPSLARQENQLSSLLQTAATIPYQQLSSDSLVLTRQTLDWSRPEGERGALSSQESHRQDDVCKSSDVESCPQDDWKLPVSDDMRGEGRYHLGRLSSVNEPSGRAVRISSPSLSPGEEEQERVGGHHR